MYSLLGWAYQRGVGRDLTHYRRSSRVFSACAGAAIYRREVFEEIGYFDEMHFAYLEDIDVGYRAGLRVMTIYTARRRWYGTSEAEPAVPSTIHSRLSWRHATMCI